MLTQLTTVKARLNILPTDPQYDDLLTFVIQAVSARFDQECNRALARTAGFIQEFNGAETEVRAACYPVESVERFDLKTNETQGWVEQTDVSYLIRRQCVLSLAAPLGQAQAQARVVYTGGYVLPGDFAGAGQSELPIELEQAAIEQVAFWFQNRDWVGVQRHWPPGGDYLQLADADLVPSVRAVIERYRRW